VKIPPKDNPLKKREGIHRLTVDFPLSAYSRLQEVQFGIGVKTKARTIRYAVKVLWSLLQQKGKLGEGWDLYWVKGAKARPCKLPDE
jgi:hypothetical protein